VEVSNWGSKKAEEQGAGSREKSHPQRARFAPCLLSITSTVYSFTENRATPVKFLDMGFKTA
jgi:hypothetical protein